MFLPLGKGEGRRGLKKNPIDLYPTQLRGEYLNFGCNLTEAAPQLVLVEDAGYLDFERSLRSKGVPQYAPPKRFPRELIE